MKARSAGWILLVVVLALASSCATPAFEKRLVDELTSSGLVAGETSRGVTIFLPEVLFEFDSADLSPSGRAAVDEVAVVLQRVAPGHSVAVEGHADSTGVEIYNLDLSIRRAHRVATLLSEAGFPSDRITAIGLGEAQPAASNEIPEGRRMNRRVEIVVLRGEVVAPQPVN